MTTRSKWQHLATEAVNPRSRNLDTRSVEEIVELMALDNRSVLAAVHREKVRIARGARLIADALLEGGRLIFVGAGTSGRLGVLEAAELPPTFSVAPGVARAIMAGGFAAVHRAKEGVEDDKRAGTRAMAAVCPRRRDAVIAISASGITPFVSGALGRARAAGARAIGITSDARSPLSGLADVTIVLSVGPEVVAGSTRLKAGTATKMVLNMLTTAAMVRAGKTYGNLMVDVKSNSEKLRDRARRIVGTLTGLDPACVCFPAHVPRALLAPHNRPFSLKGLTGEGLKDISLGTSLDGCYHVVLTGFCRDHEGRHRTPLDTLSQPNQ